MSTIGGRTAITMLFLLAGVVFFGISGYIGFTLGGGAGLLGAFIFDGLIVLIGIVLFVEREDKKHHTTQGEQRPKGPGNHAILGLVLGFAISMGVVVAIKPTELMQAIAPIVFFSVLGLMMGIPSSWKMSFEQMLGKFILFLIIAAIVTGGFLFIVKFNWEQTHPVENPTTPPLTEVAQVFKTLGVTPGYKTPTSSMEWERLIRSKVVPLSGDDWAKKMTTVLVGLTCPNQCIAVAACGCKLDVGKFNQTYAEYQSARGKVAETRYNITPPMGSDGKPGQSPLTEAFMKVAAFSVANLFWSWGLNFFGTKIGKVSVTFVITMLIFAVEIGVAFLHPEWSGITTKLLVGEHASELTKAIQNLMAVGAAMAISLPIIGVFTFAASWAVGEVVGFAKGAGGAMLGFVATCLVAPVIFYVEIVSLSAQWTTYQAIMMAMQTNPGMILLQATNAVIIGGALGASLMAPIGTIVGFATGIPGAHKHWNAGRSLGVYPDRSIP